jgi:ATP-dependent DNA helicase RecQ
LKYYTGNYVRSNHNFVIQNLKIDKEQSDLVFFDLLFNFLQRGVPTLKSNKITNFLIENDFEVNSLKPKVFISEIINNWEDIIKGDDLNNYYPAREFYNKIWNEELSEYLFVKNLIIPECPITKIIPEESQEYNTEQEVDFYIPQIKLIIEIDGYGHKDKEKQDYLRDKLFKKNEIEVVRITTFDLKNKTNKFYDKINTIKNKIKKSGTIKQYQKEYINKKVTTEEIQTSIYRFQIFLLELLKNNNDSKIEIEIKEKINIKWFNIALSDLSDMIIDFKKLTEEEYVIPEININKVKKFTKNDNIKVDFSVKKRWNDSKDRNIIKIRTDYFDYYNIDINNERQRNTGWEKYSIDYSYICNGNYIKYKANGKKLQKILQRVYNYENFNKGQIPILNNVLRGNDTIGLLPTGGGKSLCYQLPSLLQLGVTIVVCPIKSLIYDQLKELEEIGVTRAKYITGDVSSKDREVIYKKVLQGKIKYLIVSPERLQQRQFREEVIQVLYNQKKLSYFVVDEVHCLSEWGHDFRVSYLTLSKTLNTYAKKTPIICLTATASLAVLENIKHEFNINNNNIKYLKDFTRKELNFNVLYSDYQTTKIENLTSIINTEKDNSGIVFTPHVNGELGCHKLYNYFLNNYPNYSYGFFAGSSPKNVNKKTFEKNKIETQNQFKKDEIKLLFATKSFGMGVNKKNVRYTVHYGLPSSIEGLYQEAGRAGRDKIKANCYILFNQATPKTLKDLSDINIEDTTLSKNQKFINRELRGDVENQLFLMLNNKIDYKNYINSIRNVYTFLVNSKINTSGFISISKNDFNQTIDIEKTLYRLYQLGIVDNWSVEDFYHSVYLVNMSKTLNINQVRSNLIDLIIRYKNENFLLKNNFIYTTTDFDDILMTVLKWNFETFDMNRRNSLKNVNDICEDFKKSGAVEFKKNLERYFKLDLKNNVFEDFIEEDDVLKVLDLLIDENYNELSMDKIKEMKQQSNRYLESYYNNNSLKIISILIDIITNSYNDNDKLFYILCNAPDDNNLLLDKILNIFELYNLHFEEKFNINKLTYELVEYYNDTDNIIKIQKKLKDDISKMEYIKRLNKRINTVLKEL